MNRLRRRKVVALVVVVAVVAAIIVPINRPFWVTQGEVDAIAIALFRNMAQHPERDCHGVAIDGHDPDSGVMSGLRSISSIVPVSRIGVHGSFFDTQTHKSADIFSMDGRTLRWHGFFTVTVEAQAHGSGLDGYLGTYTLVKTRHGWNVVNYQDSGIMF